MKQVLSVVFLRTCIELKIISYLDSLSAFSIPVKH